VGRGSENGHVGLCPDEETSRARTGEAPDQMALSACSGGSWGRLGDRWTDPRSGRRGTHTGAG
jgi:hypothetical protein